MVTIGAAVDTASRDKEQGMIANPIY